ncbi:MAG: alpha-1,6-mannosyltransferase [Glaciecola sp.]|jgi:alpha-1,6-mannosyltransferase
MISLFLLSYLVPRTEVGLLLGIYVIGFICFLLLYKNETKHLFKLGLFARVLVLFSVPSLSDDYFRFLWDGTLIGSGLSPFVSLPAEVLAQASNMNDSSFVNDLYTQMNSRPYFSLYPPINQWIFWLAAAFSSVKWGVFVIKLAILLGELGMYWVLKKLLVRFSLNPNKLAVYWLNPLVIIELCGNAHLDGLMVMFFLLSTLCFSTMKDKEGSVYFAFAGLSKLFSLMFFPLVLLKLSMNRRVKALLMVVVVVVACYFPFLNLNDLQNMGSSFDLYFQRFEFNASFYYLLSYFGTKMMGYNPIAVLGPWLAVLSTLLILLVSYLYRFRNRLAMYTGFLLINSIYLLFSPIVHPWYLVMLVALSVLSEYRFAMAWSGMVFVSYWAYGNSDFEENYWLIMLEYLVVLGFLYMDIKKHFTFKKFKAGLGIYS